MSSEHGSSSRTYKSALLWCVAEDGALLAEEARKVLAWEDIDAESETLRIDESQHRQIEENLKRAKRDLREAVWRTYRNVFLLDETNALRRINLGLVHSSAAESLVGLILERLQQEDLVVDGVSPNFLVRNWPPALPEWSTKAVRGAFFASPKFPRLLNADAVKQTICRGVEAGMMAYVVKEKSGKYDPFMYRESLSEVDIEVTGDVFLISKEAANAYIEGQVASEDGQSSVPSPDQTKQPDAEPGEAGITGGSTSVPPAGTTPDIVPGFRWIGGYSAAEVDELLHESLGALCRCQGPQALADRRRRARGRCLKGKDHGVEGRTKRTRDVGGRAHRRHSGFRAHRVNRG